MDVFSDITFLRKSNFNFLRDIEIIVNYIKATFDLFFVVNYSQMYPKSKQVVHQTRLN